MSEVDSYLTENTTYSDEMLLRVVTVAASLSKALNGEMPLSGLKIIRKGSWPTPGATPTFS